MYKVQVYVNHGFYEYEVEQKSSAIEHAQTIMASGVYRRSTEKGAEFYPVLKVKVVGEGLESAYKDTFMRT